jgi:hypothetical protein
MTLSLEDAAMLGGLPCAGEAMRPIDIPATWQADFLALRIKIFVVVDFFYNFDHSFYSKNMQALSLYS